MAGAGTKGFLDRTWAEPFNETRDVATRNTPIDLPYGKQILETTLRGGRGFAPVIKNAYIVTDNYPSRLYTQSAYQNAEPAYTNRQIPPPQLLEES